ncbi:MAG: diguanylate cyclase [Lachnospira sp.]|nr:diguanylate cyclase [Lachnospira sp.]
MKHILIVDDNKFNLLAAKTTLEDIYMISEVRSGTEALQFLKSNKPDLILLDIIMPDMDGFEVMEIIKNTPEISSIPIVFLTADTEADTESKCLSAGAMDFIVKPFVPAVMRSRIARILELEDFRMSLANRLDEKIQEVSQIKSKSLQDALTGLWNRTYTEDKVNEMLKKGIGGALFMIDMDNFKLINDRYGHIAGDHTLKIFAEILKKYAHDDDIICRIGGDEFMIFVAGEIEKATLGDYAANVIREMCESLDEARFETNSSVSIGIAQFPEDGKDFGSLYNAADKALYHVKQNGKNSYHFYSDQSIAENERAGKCVDLDYIREMMKRTDAGNGTYMLDFGNFHHIYNFIRRIVERTDGEVQTLLFTLKPDTPNYSEDPNEIEKAVELLESAVFSSLRRVDVSTRYSSRQVIVILFNTNEENGHLVADRIMNRFRSLYNGKLDFEYDIVQMVGNPVERKN